MSFELISSRSLTDEEIESFEFSSRHGLLLSRRQTLLAGYGAIMAAGALTVGTAATPALARTAGEAVGDLLKARFGGETPRIAAPVVAPEASPIVQVAAINATPEPQRGTLLAQYNTADNEDLQDRTQEQILPPRILQWFNYECTEVTILRKFRRFGRYRLFFVSRIERSVTVNYSVQRV